MADNGRFAVGSTMDRCGHWHGLVLWQQSIYVSRLALGSLVLEAVVPRQSFTMGVCPYRSPCEHALSPISERARLASH